MSALCRPPGSGVLPVRHAAGSVPGPSGSGSAVFGEARSSQLLPKDKRLLYEAVSSAEHTNWSWI